MPIALPEISSLQFLRALKDIGTASRLIRDEAGDLSYARINDLQRAEHALRVAYVGVQSDVSAGFTSVIVGFLNARGVPGTAGEINSALAAFQSAFDAWQLYIRDVAQEQSTQDLVDISANNLNGETLRTIRMKDFIPSTTTGNTTDAGEVRASAQLAAVISAAEALGA